MDFLNGKRIVLGITGGIAAYKAAELTRLLVAAGAQLRVIMTQGAQAFITPLSLQALSGNPVHHQLLDERAESGMGHIELARWADRILVAPASANFMARLAHGLADDLLTACCLASTAPISIAPAMNHAMWNNPQTQKNAQQLSANGISLWGPAHGKQACGETGPGRMLEATDLAHRLSDSFSNDLLGGLRVLITAGPTREAIDAVRFISNRSSGKMGFAIAQAAHEAGADVTLISGPVALDTPDGINRIDIETAEQMGQAVLDRIDRQHILIGSAAVSDYVPAVTQRGKMKKTTRALCLDLKPGMDIMQAVGNLQKRPFTVGFAAETGKLEYHAQDKRRRKNMDMIAANLVGRDDRGFETDDNELIVFWHNGRRVLPLNDKNKIARQLVELISQQYQTGHRGKFDAPPA